MDWFIIGIISSIFFGIQKFLFKVAAENKCSTKVLTFFFMATVSLLGFIAFHIQGGAFFNLQQLVVIAFFNGFFFLLVSIFRYESLKFVPGTVAYPLMELTSVLVIVFSLVYFKDTLSTYQMFGVTLGLIVSYLLFQRHQDEKTRYGNFSKGLLFILVAVIAGAITQVISKFVAVSQIDLMLYITVSYLFNTLFILGHHTFGKKSLHISIPKFDKSFYYGVLIGVTNFIAFYTYLKALEPGSLALVTILLSFSTLIPVVLSVLIYKDKLTLRRIVAIVLTIVSLILIQK